MRVALLGELVVVDDQGRDLPVPGAKLRSLLAMLALDVGRVVPAEQLVDALWGEAPPATVRNSLQGLASKLRRTLGPAGPVTMRGSGYVLELPAGAVDAHRFEELAREGRAAAASGALETAVTVLTEADSLWRGEALADFAYEEFAAAAIARLSELRLAVLEERLDIELGLGRHHAATVQLEKLVSMHPLRERPRWLLMLALYRAGRQADALRTFREGRRILAEELGLEPGHQLRELEAAILAQDRSLDVAPAAPRPAGDAPGRAHLPASLTPLIGRDVELHDLSRLLAAHRLVTLVGPGGVGKTRLALEVARAASAHLPSGACLVELAPVGSPAGLGAAIAGALDVPDPGRLADVIGEREMLILIDNCEHVIDAAAEIAEDLLRRCPGLRLLATSREGLRVSGEVIWPVPPLATADAVGLFIARSRAAGAQLERPEDHVAVIADICARLDGLPLAIELAAARSRTFPVGQIAARLDDRFRLLTGGSRTALPRQQTLKAVVDWSYELLFEDEQRVFERLSVFPGGCDLPTAEVVCADETLAGDDLHDLIQALVDKSLVTTVAAADGPRFTQLQTLAQYGCEKLAERGDSAAVRHAMAGHYARLCAQSAAAYIGDGQRAWLIAIDQENANLKAALEWAVANDDAETALTIAGGASWPHWLAGTVVEGRRWLDDAFACRGPASERARALALTGRGLLEFLAGSPERADADLEEALAIFGRRRDDASVVLARSFYAEIAAVRGDGDEARRRRLEVIEFYGRRPDEPFSLAAGAYSRGKLGLLDGDLTRAEVEFRAAVDGFSRIDRPVMLSMSLGMVADFDERAGDHAAAIRTLEAAIATNDSLGLRGFMGSLVVRLGWALLNAGDVGRAEAVYERALDEARRLRNEPVLFLALVGMAVVHRAADRDANAGAAGGEALELYLAVAAGPRRFRNRIDQRNDMLVGAAACCSVLAAVAVRAGEGERAARLLGHADRLRGEADAPVPPFQRDDIDRTRAGVVELLGEHGYEAARDAGRRSDLVAELRRGG